MRRLLTALTAAGILGSMALVGAQSAAAAEFTPTRTSVAVSPTTVTSGFFETVTMAFSFCVPDEQVAGDSFEMVMPTILVNWPDSFSVADGTGQAVLDVTISDASPAVATYTLTAYGASVAGLCATVNAGANTGQAEAGTYPLEFRIGAEIITPTPETLTVQAPRFTIPTQDGKYGFATDSTDQCREDTAGCLGWGFVLAAGDRGPVTVRDPAPPGWRFDCQWGWFVVNTINDDGTRTSRTLDPADVLTGYSCSPTLLEFTADTTGLADNQHYEFQALASAAAPGADGGVTYRNEATVTVAGEPTQVATSYQSAYIGGTAEGDGVRITKRDASGNDANDPGTAVPLPDGSASLVMVVRNTGTTDLRDLTITDALTAGSGAVADLSCDFSQAVPGAPTQGTTWAGPLPPRASFECTATLSGVTGDHVDTATITATGNAPVTDDDPYHATGPAPSPSPTSPSPSPTSPSPSPTATTPSPSPSSPSPTSSTSSPPPTTGNTTPPNNGGGALASTGVNPLKPVLFALALLVVGLLLTATARQKRRH